MNVFLCLKKVLLGALCISQLAICANATSDVCHKDPVTKLKKQIDECEWLDPECKDLLSATPPFRPFCEQAIQQIKDSIQPKSEINLEQAKTDAIKFFSKYLAKMPDFINIAKDVINNGHYTYVDFDNWIHIIDSQMQSVISEDDNWSKNIEGIVQSLMEGKTKDEIIKLYMPFLNIDNPLNAESVREAKKFIDEVECKYMDLSNVAKNFEIQVSYTSRKTLLITAIHETGHVLDYAYRIKYGKRSKTFSTDLEAISVFFETIAKRELESDGYDVLRLVAPYGTMAGFDLLQRANNRLNGTVSDTLTLEQIRQEIEEDWQSPLGKLVNLDISNGEIITFVQWIRSGGALNFTLYDHLKQMFRMKIVLDSEKDLINKIPETMERLVMESSPTLTGSEYLQLYNSIIV